MTMTPDELARACAEAMWAEDKASRHLGMVLGAITPGKATITMTVTETMVNGHGLCHGGYIFALADSTFAFACNTYNARTVAQGCAITYVASARLGDVLTATGVEISRSGRSGVYDILVKSQTGATIAVFRGNSRTIKGEFFPGITIAG